MGSKLEVGDIDLLPGRDIARSVQQELVVMSHMEQVRATGVVESIEMLADEETQSIAYFGVVLCFACFSCIRTGGYGGGGGGRRKEEGRVFVHSKGVAFLPHDQVHQLCLQKSPWRL